MPVGHVQDGDSEADGRKPVFHHQFPCWALPGLISRNAVSGEFQAGANSWRALHFEFNGYSCAHRERLGL